MVRLQFIYSQDLHSGVTLVDDPSQAPSAPFRVATNCHRINISSVVHRSASLDDFEITTRIREPYVSSLAWSGEGGPASVECSWTCSKGTWKTPDLGPTWVALAADLACRSNSRFISILTVGV